MNKIAEVVLPLKEDAIKKAEEHAKTLIENCRKNLAENDNDLGLVAPYPKAGRLSTAEYWFRMGKYTLYNKLVKHRKSTRMMNEPDYVDIYPEYCERFITQSREDAAIQYDAFVAKLVEKIGEVKDVKLIGNHVWSFSILTVEKEGGIIEHWKTQMIINVSKHGKIFNQWPTRKVKKW